MRRSSLAFVPFLVLALGPGSSGQTGGADRVVAWRPDHAFGAVPDGTGFTDRAAALGAPDFPAGANTGAVSLGAGGRLLLAFIDNHLAIDGGAAADLLVIEVQAPPSRTGSRCGRRTR